MSERRRGRFEEIREIGKVSRRNRIIHRNPSNNQRDQELTRRWNQMLAELGSHFYELHCPTIQVCEPCPQEQRLARTTFPIPIPSELLE